MKWVCADSARAEQRAAKDYREKQEKTQRARDLSTQAAMNEKLAAKKRIAIQPIKGYDENENASVAKGVEVSKNFLSEAATGGISLASDVATMIKNISEYSTEGKIIVTLGQKSTKLSDLIEWIVL